MRLIHRHHTSEFQQDIYHDDSNGLYYEIMRIRMAENVEFYIGEELSTSVDDLTGLYYTQTGKAVRMKMGIEIPIHSHIFPIKKRERWSAITARLPSYIMRATL